MTIHSPAWDGLVTLPGIPARRSTAWWVVLGLALLYGIYFSVYTVQRHNAFLTSAWDLGNFDQAIWNTAQGRPFAMSNLPGVTVRFAHHVEPILLLIAPLYWLWSDVRLLLVVQSFAIGLSALPLFDYAKGRIGGWGALLLAAAYLLLPALQGVNTFDFHAVALAPLFLLMAWRYLDERRNLPFAVAAILAAATKEEISLLIAMMGLYALLVQRRAFGWAPFVLGVGWFLLVLEVITPTFNVSGGHEFLGYYAHWGDSASEVLLSMLTRPLEVVAWLAQPERSGYLLHMLAPTLGLALLAPQVLLIAAPSLAVNLLSTYPPMTDPVGYHYPAPIVPFVMGAGAAGLGFLTSRFIARPRGRRWANIGGAAAMLTVALFMQRESGATPLATGWRWPDVTDHHEIGTDLMAMVPQDATVSAQSHINPHLSQRQQIYRYPDGQESADYLVFDVTVPDLFVHPNDLKADILGKLESGEWSVYGAEDGWLTLRRCDESAACETRIPDSFYSYARAGNAEPQYRADIQYGDVLRLTGYDLLEQGLETEVRFYWEALRPITDPIRPFPLFFDRTWTIVLEDTNQRPLMETVWYPPQQWRVGETVQTTTLPFAVGADYNLVMAVLADGSQPEGPRLPVTVGPGSALPEIAKENAPTLLRVRSGRVQAGTLRQYELPDGVPTLAVEVGDSIRLAGAEVQDEAKSGYTIEVTVYWEAQGAPRTDYTSFVQLIGGGAPVSQSDQYPVTELADGFIQRPTSGWVPGEMVADTHILSVPPDLTPGVYTVIAGMYDSANGAARLPVTREGERLADDVVAVGTVMVSAP